MKQNNSNPIISLILKSFFQGLVIIGPIGFTIAVIWYIVSAVDNSIPNLSAKTYPGVTFLLVICFTTLLGYLGNKFIIGRFFIDKIDYLLERLPGVKHIYTPTKDVMSSFVGDKKKFDNPVWVKTNENPEVWRIGFLTQKNMGEVGMVGYVAVYLPHSYAISGWVIITKKENIKPVEGMNSAAAMKFAVSGGIAGFKVEEGKN